MSQLNWVFVLYCIELHRPEQNGTELYGTRNGVKRKQSS